jgi:ABC-type nitrate/sulfonate/bicarbonate transport system substrate-binding protein
MVSERVSLRVIASVFCCIAALLAGPVAAQEKIPIATFPFPSISNIYADLIQAKGFDKANGFQVEPIVYGTGGALWAGLAKGEIVMHNSSLYLATKLRGDGVPLQVVGTLFDMGWQVITRNPEIKSIRDLKGKSLAATVAFSEYDFLDIYARKQGINFKTDVNIVDASTSLMQAQLEAGRVDAILAWDPALDMTLAKNPDAKVVVNGSEAWRSVAGGDACESCLIVRTDYLKEHPTTLKRLLKMYSDAAEFAKSNPEEADAIVTSGKYATKGVPPGTIKAGLTGKRLLLNVRPAWDPAVNSYLWKTLALGVETGKIPALPPKDLIIDASP